MTPGRRLLLGALLALLLAGGLVASQPKASRPIRRAAPTAPATRPPSPEASPEAARPPGPAVLPDPAAPIVAGTGLKELLFRIDPAVGSGIPRAEAVLGWDGRGTLRVGGRETPLTVGPQQMDEIGQAVEESRAHADGRFGDPACGPACAHVRIEVRPIRGAAWTLERHGEAGPEPVGRLVLALLSAVRPS